MPKYELIKKQEQIKLKERAKHAESTQATRLKKITSISIRRQDAHICQA